MGDDDKDIVKMSQKFTRCWESHASEWVEEARRSYDYVAGHQWSEQDRAAMEAAMRPVITFNRIGTFIDSVSGLEVSNRQEVRYIPREQGDVRINELLTSAAQWVRDNADAEDEESEAFLDLVISGMGWTETSMDYESDPDGMIRIDRRDPLEMEWDPKAKKRNLSDARWVKRNVMMHKDDVAARWPDKAERIGLGGIDYPEGDEIHDADNAREYRSDQGGGDAPKSDEIKVSQLQWWEREAYFRVETDQGIIDVKASRWAALRKFFPSLRAVRITKRVYKQAWLAGDTVLESGPCPYDNGFTLKCMTGKRDRNSNTWYGLVRGLMDPQKWANKFLSSILEKAGKRGAGVIAEKDAFINPRQAETDWANDSKITWAKNGALSQARIMPKPPGQPTSELSELMGFSINSFRDISGINLELMGLKDQQQAGVLEAQRKQAGISILSWCFDSLRKYRKEQGRCLAYFIQEYISDGRLVRVVGEQGKQYVPLVRDEGAMTYDVIVDESPSSPNMKERVWAILQPIIPTMAQLGMQVPPDIIEYMPLPETLIEKWKQGMQPDPQQQQAQQQAAQLAVAAQQAQIQQAQAKAQLDAAKAQETQAGLQLDAEELDAKVDLMEADKVVKIAQARKLAAETGRDLAG